ncbi:MAG: hypothetical protein MUE80_01975 [Acidobacteria bacterium]|jgi:hypothetical protein|nr:hypothetical protein [Acidobacteriota bacterium]
MKKDKDEPNKVSTCFDGSPRVEEMQKVLGGGGIGSLCEAILRSAGKEFGGGPQVSEEQKWPAREDKPRRQARAAQGRKNDQQNGGVK